MIVESLWNGGGMIVEWIRPAGQARAANQLGSASQRANQSSQARLEGPGQVEPASHQPASQLASQSQNEDFPGFCNLWNDCGMVAKWLKDDCGTIVE